MEVVKAASTSTVFIIVSVSATKLKLCWKGQQRRRGRLGKGKVEASKTSHFHSGHTFPSSDSEAIARRVVTLQNVLVSKDSRVERGQKWVFWTSKAVFHTSFSSLTSGD